MVRIHLGPVLRAENIGRIGPLKGSVMADMTMIALGFRVMLKFLGIAVLAVALLAWFVGWLRDKLE